MIKEKLQQVRHDTGSGGEAARLPWSSPTLGIKTSASYFDWHLLCVMVGSGHIAVGHSTNIAAYFLLWNGSWLPAPQAKTWEATHVAGEIYTIETFAYDYDNAEAQCYQFSWKLMEKWKPENGMITNYQIP